MIRILVMAIDKTKVDALMFDMDGTLWNAMDSYAEVWNQAFAEYGQTVKITGDDLLDGMGKTLEQILDMICERFGATNPGDGFLQRVDDIEDVLLPRMGGVLYADVKEGLAKLSQRYPIFLVSNCGVNGLVNFMEYTGLRQFVTDYLTYGMTRLSKADSMLMLKHRHQLQNPVYVGDTQGDCNETHRAGMKFVFCNYGFGTCADYDMQVDCFKEIIDYFL